MKELKFSSPEQFIVYLMHNEGIVVGDGYGRKWYYKNYKFYFKDIGTNDKFEEGLKCLHLFATRILKIPEL